MLRMLLLALDGALQKSVHLGEIFFHVRGTALMDLALDGTVSPGWHVTVAGIKLTHVVNAFHDFTNGRFPQFLAKIIAIVAQGNEKLTAATVGATAYNMKK